eukprot:16102946-Heterocapsa_arctica.AAC.1
MVDVYPARSAYVDKLIAEALSSQWHPRYPGEVEWKLHAILKGITSGTANESARGLQLTVVGEVGAAAAGMAGAAAERLAELPDAFSAAAAEKRGKPKAKGKPKTQEQTAAAEAKTAVADRKKALTVAHKKIQAAIAGVNTVTSSLSVAVGEEQLTPKDMAVNATMAELLQLLQTAD